MARHVIWTDAALSALEAIAEYIARDSQFYAADFVNKAFEASDSLAKSPEAAGMVPEFGNPAIREIFVKKYRLIFEVSEGAVRILTVIHGARDLRTFFDDIDEA